MKKLLVASLSLLFVFAFVGCKEKEPEVTDPNADVFTVKLELGKGVSLSSVDAKLCDEEGYELGTATLQKGNNTLPKPEEDPYYIVCSVSAEYDCPVVYADGTATATVSVQKADGEYTFTAFAKNADKTKNFTMQMCDNVTGWCNLPATLDESGTKFVAVIAYNENYEFEIKLDGEIIFAYDFPFTAEHRFTVVDLAE